MGKRVLDREFGNRLRAIHEPVEFCDETGESLGHYLPPGAYEEIFYTALTADSPHSAEELKRRHQETGGSSLAEIWARLGRQ